MHASQIQGCICIVEQRVEKKRKIAESVWVNNVATVRTGIAIIMMVRCPLLCGLNAASKMVIIIATACTSTPYQT